MNIGPFTEELAVEMRDEISDGSSAAHVESSYVIRSFHASWNPLEAVLDLLHAGGWVQGAWSTRDGHCLVGALGLVFDVDLRRDADLKLPSERLNEIDDWRILRTARLLCAVTDEEYSPTWSLSDMLTGVVLFNDKSDTSYENVLLAVKRAAASWDATFGHQMALPEIDW